MRLILDQVANGFIVTRSNIAMETQESHVFESIDALCKHLRQAFTRTDNAALNMMTNPYVDRSNLANFPRQSVLD